MSKASTLPYICNPEDIQEIQDLGQGYFRIQRKAERFPACYYKLNNGAHDFYVQTRLPRDLFLKAVK